jgi:hypothetical protein
MWKSGLLISYSHPNAFTSVGLYSLRGNNIAYSPAFYYPYLSMQPVTYYANIGAINDTAAIGEISYSMKPEPLRATYNMNGCSYNNVMGINYTYHIKYDTAEAYDYNDQFLFSGVDGLVQLKQFHLQDSMDRNWQLIRGHLVQ